jgi:hypothetical protein
VSKRYSFPSFMSVVDGHISYLTTVNKHHTGRPQGHALLMSQRIDRRRFNLGKLGGGTDSSEAAGAASFSRRRSAPSWSVMNSRLPKWKLWEGGNGGGAHNLSRGTMGNSREPKRIIRPWLAAGAAIEVMETILSPKQ